MNRYEQITSEAKKHYYDDINCYNAFLHGVEWAEKHPANVWHDASEEPKGKYYIVCQDTLECVWLTNRREDMKYHQTGWEECVMCECIVRWAYVKDILPKGGKK